MKINRANIAGCLIIEREVCEDHRGWFTETFRKDRLVEAIGHDIHFVQDNVSYSGLHVLRGLHFQRSPDGQAKFLTVIRGAIRDVVVDIRTESPTYGQHFQIDLTQENRRALYIPKGMAHGFLSLTADTILTYKCDAYYNPGAEAGIRFDDPELGIDWGVPHEDLVLSERDRNWPFFNTFKE